MSGKVIAFPVQPALADENNVLWIVAIHRTFQEEYSCEYKSDERHWVVCIHSKTFASAMSFVEQCRHTLGLDQSINREAAMV